MPTVVRSRSRPRTASRPSRCAATSRSAARPDCRPARPSTCRSPSTCRRFLWRAASATSGASPSTVRATRTGRFPSRRCPSPSPPDAPIRPSAVGRRAAAPAARRHLGSHPLVVARQGPVGDRRLRDGRRLRLRVPAPHQQRKQPEDLDDRGRDLDHTVAVHHEFSGADDARALRPYFVVGGGGDVVGGGGGAVVGGGGGVVVAGGSGEPPPLLRAVVGVDFRPVVVVVPRPNVVEDPPAVVDGPLVVLAPASVVVVDDEDVGWATTLIGRGSPAELRMPAMAM